MEENLNSPDIQHAVDEAFSIENFEKNGPEALFHSLEILTENGMFHDLHMGDSLSITPHKRYGIEGINKAGKSAAVDGLNKYYATISEYYRPDIEAQHFVAILREPSVTQVEQPISASLNLDLPSYSYRLACLDLVKHPFQQALMFMLGRNRVHNLSSEVIKKYQGYNIDEVMSLLTSDVRIPEHCLADVRENNEEWFFSHLYRLRNIEGYNFPLEFFHDRNQLSTLVYQSKKLSDLSGVPYEQVLEVVYMCHRRLEDLGYLDPFDAFLVLMDKDNTPHKRDLYDMFEKDTNQEFDQYEKLFQRREEMVLYSKVVKFLRLNTNIPVVVMENSKKSNTIDQLGYAISHLFCNIYRDSDLKNGVKIKLPRYMSSEDEDVLNVDLGEIKIENGIMRWKPREEWYENVPLQSTM